MNINIYCPLNTTSYGYVSCYLIRELVKKGVSLHCDVISQPSIEQKFFDSAQAAVNTPPNDGPCIKIWHQHDLFPFKPDGSITGKGPHIGFPIFELDTFTDQELNSLRYPDYLFVCSDWARDVVLQQCPDRKSEDVFVVPLGIDPEIFKPALSFNQRKNPTVFFNAGKWEYRKGHDILIDAFTSSFTMEDNVELWMMPHNAFLSPEKTKEWEDLYLKSPLGSKIKIIPRQPGQEDVYNLMQQADCGVFPSRAEGWNLELLEMMALGKYVITTNVTAHTQFCCDNNSRLIDLPEKEVAVDNVFFKGQGNWHKWTDEAKSKLKTHMKWVHLFSSRNYRDGSEMLKRAQETGQSFTWENSANAIMKHLQQIGG
jgi:glycosyltransferase involved in cell wall biosynthesis